MDIPFYSGPISVPNKEINPPVGYWTVALLRFLRLPWGGGVAPHHGENRKLLKQYLNKEKARTGTLDSSTLINIESEKWSVAHTIKNTVNFFLSIKINRHLT